MKISLRKIKLRYFEVKDAKRFYEILKDPSIKYFPVPKTLASEVKYVKNSIKERKKRKTYDFTIIYEGEVIGGIGIIKHNQFTGGIGYFIDKKYRGKGIATYALNKLIDFGFKKIKLVRIEAYISPQNKASERVAIKAGFKKEGLLRKVGIKKGKPVDRLLYAKVK